MKIKQPALPKFGRLLKAKAAPSLAVALNRENDRAEELQAEVDAIDQALDAGARLLGDKEYEALIARVEEAEKKAAAALERAAALAAELEPQIKTWWL